MSETLPPPDRPATGDGDNSGQASATFQAVHTRLQEFAGDGDNSGQASAASFAALYTML
ncbi:MAG TPA: hypothetical protein VFV38_49065 [Ktedonobacteraceae bacterium]|nr:hypothetical protein [Ktedonobacteraceae bacterium]